MKKNHNTLSVISFIFAVIGFVTAFTALIMRICKKNAEDKENERDYVLSLYKRYAEFQNGKDNYSFVSFDKQKDGTWVQTVSHCRVDEDGETYSSTGERHTLNEKELDMLAAAIEDNVGYEAGELPKDAFVMMVDKEGIPAYYPEFCRWYSHLL